MSRYKKYPLGSIVAIRQQNSKHQCAVYAPKLTTNGCAFTYRLFEKTDICSYVPSPEFISKCEVWASKRHLPFSPFIRHGQDAPFPPGVTIPDKLVARRVADKFGAYGIIV